MPLPNRSVENLVHFNCPYCQKWWSVGDAPEEKKDWSCPWCHALLIEEPPPNLEPMLGCISVEGEPSYYQMVRLDPETGRYIPEGEKFYIQGLEPTPVEFLPKIEWR